MLEKHALSKLTHLHRAQTGRGKLKEYIAVSFTKVYIFTGQTILMESFRRNDLIRPMEKTRKEKRKKSSLNLFTSGAIVYYSFPFVCLLICIWVCLFVRLLICLPWNSESSGPRYLRIYPPLGAATFGGSSYFREVVIFGRKST